MNMHIRWTKALSAALLIAVTSAADGRASEDSLLQPEVRPKFKAKVAEIASQSRSKSGRAANRASLAYWAGEYMQGIGWHMETYAELVLTADGRFKITKADGGRKVVKVVGLLDSCLESYCFTLRLDTLKSTLGLEIP